MRRKPWSKMETIDDGLREAILKYSGRPPDNFVESGEGGAIDAVELAKEDPAEEERIVRGLEDRLRRLGPGDITKDDKFEY